MPPRACPEGKFSFCLTLMQIQPTGVRYNKPTGVRYNKPTGVRHVKNYSTAD
ncbi:hypothetical protein MNBD_ALPHA11-2362 [hydrothermal vent metagenome]|uniref:Uncharacterized protein n=1 Tax=hydrothermal vent metagenome TaxID=652676 RepID=A0A3B0T6K7_9ZZZZ